MTEYGRKHTDGSRSGGQPVTNDKDSAVLLHCPNCEATKQELQDFRQKVSDAVANWKDMSDFSSFGTMLKLAEQDLFGFIISKPKPDPLADAWIEATGNTVGMEPLNAALEARGLEIREKNDD